MITLYSIFSPLRTYAAETGVSPLLFLLLELLRCLKLRVACSSELCDITYFVYSGIDHSDT